MGYLNFLKNPNYISIFNGSLEVDDLIMMSPLLGDEAIFVPHETIIILDEIQDCPEARTALKFFKEDGRFDVIGTGSLLGVKGYVISSVKSRYTEERYRAELDLNGRKGAFVLIRPLST